MEENMLVVIASDTHRRNHRLLELERMYPQASLYLFAGDYGEDPHPYDHWIGVLGNNDYFYIDRYPMKRVIFAGDHKIFLSHGHQYGYANREANIAAAARENGCDIAVYGHSHVASVREVDGVTLINPGSLYRSRDGRRPSYCLLKLDGMHIEPEIRFWD